VGLGDPAFAYQSESGAHVLVDFVFRYVDLGQIES
jgi:hypothetical protein